jgi:hypothetical protein
MNTIIIFDQCGEAPVLFFVVDGDYSYLSGVYINSVSEDDEAGIYEGLQDELSLIQEKYPAHAEFPHYNYIPGDTAVIVAGFLP